MVILKLAHYSVQTILSQKYFFRLSFFWVQKFKNLKVGSLFVSNNSDPQIIFLFFFLDFCQFFCFYLKVGSLFVLDNSDPKMFISRFFVIFLCNLKVGSLFDSDNSDTKIIIYFVSRFLSIFLVILKLAHYSVQTILGQKYFSRFCRFWVQKFKNLKVGSLFVSDNSDPQIIFQTFFLDFL